MVGDPDQLRQAFMNVGVNALEALGGAGNLQLVLKEASLAAIGEEGNVRRLGSRPAVEISLANDGPPLGDEETRQLFTPFFTSKEGGTGLGLAVVHRIVSAHEGVASYTNRAEGGACFSLRIPIGGD